MTVGAGETAMQGVSLNPERFRTAFPFHLAFDSNLTVTQVGATLLKICPDLHAGSRLVGRLEIVRPAGPFSTEHIRQRLHGFFLLKHQETKLQLRGGFSWHAEDDTWLFLGSPWFTDASQLADYHLGYDDFALHDPVVDMLHVFQAHKMAMADAKQLAAKLRASREEIRQAFATLDASEDAALIVDPETLRFTYANQGAMRQIGCTSEELLRMTLVDMQPECTEAQLRALLRPMIEDERPSLTTMTQHRRKDGTEVPVEINYRYVAPPGEKPRFIAIARDITERIKSEQRLLQSQRLESIGTLAAGIAHDLNNLLAPILLSSELLHHDYPGHTETVDTILACVHRAAGTVKNLLSFAKGATGVRAHVKAEALIREVEKIITTSFPKNIYLRVMCAPDLPSVMADANQLHQVLVNLCVNARDAMANGGTLTLEAGSRELDSTYVTAVPDAKPGQYLVVRVSDNGAGMAPDIVDRVFDPYFTTKSPDRGTGLGLSTVAGIVKGHGGFVQVYSNPGVGSTFAIYLPADTSAHIDDRPTKASDEFRGSGETVLLVDDEAGIRAVATRVLTRLQLTPLVASDGVNGLVMVVEHRHTVKAAIVDFHMPHMDGEAFIRAVRQMLPDLPIAVASGALDPGSKRALESLGVRLFLQKPFTQMEMVSVVSMLLAST